MDRTGKIILVVSVLAMIFGMPLAMRLGLIKMSPADNNATAVTDATNQVTQAGTNQVPVTGTNAPVVAPTNSPTISTNAPPATNQPAPPTTNQPAPPVVEIPVVEESTLTLSSDKAKFTFTSLGGGVKQVDLLEYPRRCARIARITSPPPLMRASPR